MPKITAFDSAKPHIYTPLQITGRRGTVLFNAILDTGAPYTELSDRSLARAGFQDSPANVTLRDFQETQKHPRIRLPVVEILGQHLHDWIVYVSRFDETWGIDALIGLDFFRRFRTTIDYEQGEIVVESFK